MSFYIDLTEFLTNPITTGVQRIAGELCKFFPPSSAIPVRLHAGHYISLPSTLISAVGKHFSDPSESALQEIRRLGAIETGSAVGISKRDVVLVPEIFLDPERLAFFRNMSDRELRRYRFIVYDLVPITHPEYFWSEWLLQTYGYFQLIRRAACCGFISEHTRNAYYGRLKRVESRGGPVLALGCDSFGARPDQLAFNRRLTFTVIGNVEPRKNHGLILAAFEPLLQQIRQLSLSFIGKLGSTDSQLTQRVLSLAFDRNSGFRFYSSLGDGEIRNAIGQSRATIYISAAEGYGLPPVESLWMKTPVIASTTIPSLERLGSAGVHYVDPLNVINLRRAILAFLDDGYANQKVKETANICLPTWESFSQEVLRWCSEEAID